VHTAGIVAGTLSGLAYAFVIIFSRRLSQLMLHHKAIIVNLWITAAYSTGALTADYHVSFRAGALLLVTGLLHSNLAPLLYFHALRKVIAQHAAILGYMEPLAAIPLAFFFLSETPTLITLFGGILILVSGYMVMHYGKGSENVPTAE
jgi:drug/metabolite transporter (DMT)-like permease